MKCEHLVVRLPVDVSKLIVETLWHVPIGRWRLYIGILSGTVARHQPTGSCSLPLVASAAGLSEYASCRSMCGRDGQSIPLDYLDSLYLFDVDIVRSIQAKIPFSLSFGNETLHLRVPFWFFKRLQPYLTITHFLYIRLPCCGVLT